MKTPILKWIIIVLSASVLAVSAYYLWQSSQIQQRSVQTGSDTETEPAKNNQPVNITASTESELKTLIESPADEVMLAIKNNDFQKLSTYVHPQKGVRFSPYSYVIVQNDLVFSVDQVRDAITDKKNYVWGSFDGSGFPIELTFGEYFKRFVYSHDFANAEEISYNRIIGTGNTINNVFDAYPNGIIVEYHFPGFDPEFGGMDWESLRLVFEQMNGRWYLVGIIHDQWTI